jgi:hypothetical protein
MQTISTAQYITREDPMPGDRISDSAGRLGTVRKVRTGSRAMLDGELAVQWDEGVMTINYRLAGNFALVSRARPKM